MLAQRLTETLPVLQALLSVVNSYAEPLPEAAVFGRSVVFNAMLLWLCLFDSAFFKLGQVGRNISYRMLIDMLAIRKGYLAELLASPRDVLMTGGNDKSRLASSRREHIQILLLATAPCPKWHWG